MYKSCNWIELDAKRAEILEINVPDDYVGEPPADAPRKIKHPELPRARWFNLSKSGNWYWRCTDRRDDNHGRAYILK